MFRKSLIIVGITMITCLNSFSAFSQGFDASSIRAVLGLGYAVPAGEGGGGVALTFEPGYNLSEQLTFGLRFEGAFLARGGDDEASLEINGSYALTGQYYFGSGKFKPFVGAGVGLFTFAGIEATTTQLGASEGDNQIGFIPRVGFDLGHFNLTVDYNLIGNTEVNALDINGGQSTLEIENSYIGIKIGGIIGGGR